MNYSSLTLFFMSGTGNSLRVAKWMAEAAAEGLRQERGAAARLVPYNQAGPDSFPAGGERPLLGLVFPTHAFTAPWPMILLCLRLPRGRGAHAFVAATRAGTKFGRLFLPGFEGTACYLLALLLALKGYRVRGVKAVDMPSNWIAAHPGFSPRSARAIIERARPRALGFIGAILDGRRRFGVASFICLVLGLALLPVSLGYLLIGRFFLAKLFFASSRCDGCGLCARSCAARAVRMWGRRRPRPYWSFSCESCMRCMAFCPRQAVEAGHSWGVLLFLAVAMPVGVYLLGILAPLWPALGQIHNPWLLWLVRYPFGLLAIFLVYLLFTLLLRVRAINALFTFTTFTHIWRRYHEPDTSLTDLTAGGDGNGLHSPQSRKDTKTA